MIVVIFFCIIISFNFYFFSIGLFSIFFKFAHSDLDSSNNLQGFRYRGKVSGIFFSITALELLFQEFLPPSISGFTMRCIINNKIPPPMQALTNLTIQFIN